MTTAKRVLVVDDEEAVAKPIEHILRLYNYDVTMTTQWTDALELIQDEPFDLITLDLEMPTIDGPTMLRFIREKGLNTPVIIISASITDKTPQDLAEFEVSAFVYKPFKVSHIKEIVEQTIGESEAPKEADEVDLDEFLQSSPQVLAPRKEEAEEEQPHKHRRRKKRKKKLFSSKEQKTQTLIAFAIIAVISLFLSGFMSKLGSMF
ncbi:MAG: response regulator [Candidatus Latescibacteria bacterium]|nr:response regulator [Candidatus Latescibacterota bacterium]